MASSRKRAVAVLQGMMVCWSAGGVDADASANAKRRARGAPTLQVYTDLLQVPTLVLGPMRERLGKPIAPERFAVSIDGGQWFQATHAQQQGDDPIALTILLDESGNEVNLLPKMEEAIASLAPMLRPQDRVSLYTLDCSLTNTANDVAADGAALKQAVERGWSPGRNEMGQRRGPDCHQAIHLWDATEMLTKELAKRPGRRVMLLLSDGNDRGSQHIAEQVHGLANESAVTIFGVTYASEVGTAADYGGNLSGAAGNPTGGGGSGGGGRRGGGGGAGTMMTGNPGSGSTGSRRQKGQPGVDPTLIDMCEMSGGVVQVATPGSLK